MRLVIARFTHELNSFVPQKTELGDFEGRELKFGGDAISFNRGTRSAIGGFIETAEKENVELIPVFSTFGGQGGPVTTACYKYFEEYFLHELEKIGKYDGILLALHGAMVSENSEDPEGDFIAAIRKKVGKSIPIVATFDLHGNMTPKIVNHLDALVAQKTFPHVDNFEIGEKATGLILSIIQKNIKPVIALKRLPMIVPAVNAQTTEGPMREIIERAKEIEQEDKVIDVSIFEVQPWMDLQDIGWSVVVTTDNDIKLANEKMNEIAKLVWRARKKLNEVEEYTIEEALAKAMKIEGGPVVFADSADASPHDSPLVLRALLENKFKYPAALTINDRPVVEECIRKGVGEEINLEVGAKIAKELYDPVPIHARIKLISDGKYIYHAPLNKGKEMNMGKTVVLIINGNINLVVYSQRNVTFDPAQYRSVGIEPKEMKIVLVKSVSTFRPGYQDIARENIMLKTAGALSSDLLSLPYRNIKRPLYPWDEMHDYSI